MDVQANSPSATAMLLAESAKDIDSVARGRFTNDEDLYHKIIASEAAIFLHRFRKAVSFLVPELQHLRRNTPVGHAGIYAPSYHELAYRIASKQHEYTAIPIRGHMPWSAGNLGSQ